MQEKEHELAEAETVCARRLEEAEVTFEKRREDAVAAVKVECELLRLREMEALRQNSDRERQHWLSEKDEWASWKETVQGEKDELLGQIAELKRERSSVGDRSASSGEESGAGVSELRGTGGGEEGVVTTGVSTETSPASGVTTSTTSAPIATVASTTAGGTPTTTSASVPTSTSASASTSASMSMSTTACVSTPMTSTSLVMSTPTLLSTSVSSTEGVVHSVTKLLEAQTQMVAKAMIAQSFPPLSSFTGENEEESFERWLESFEDRARVAGWSSEQSLYQLKCHLAKTALQAFRVLSKEEKLDYKRAVAAMKKRFTCVDIEELRGMAFHSLVQEQQSTEQLGLDLQKLAQKAFPSLSRDDFDRLLKGRFYSALLPKWQKKLGAPRPTEKFRDLYERARTVERHEAQFQASAATRRE